MVPLLILHVFSQAYTFRLSKDKYERIKVDAKKNSETFFFAPSFVGQEGRKETMSTTSTRSVTNITGQTNQLNLI